MLVLTSFGYFIVKLIEMSNSKSVSLTKDEALLLVNLVGANTIVTSKATDATNNQLKDTAWSKITEEFNSSISSCPRETKQLRLKWENLKKTARKRFANIRMNQYKTGGGKPDYIPPDEPLDLVASILGATCEGYSVPFGGDASDDTILITEPVACLPSADPLPSAGGPDVVVGDGTGEIIVVDTLPTVTKPNRKFLFESSSKRTAKSRKIDELAASNILRNTAVAKYYSKKTELLSTAFEEQKLKLKRIELENEKLKIELENSKNSTCK